MANLFPIAEAAGEKRTNAVFFHGLGGDAKTTWRARPDEASFWPAWLAQEIRDLSVYSVDYEAPVSRWTGSAMHLTDRAKNVLACLLAEPGLAQGQLVLIGHSLGGLLIKQLLRMAEIDAWNGVEAASFLSRVKKVAFLATPHTGAGLATWGDKLRILLWPTEMMACLVHNDPYLRELNLWYRSWANRQNVAHLILTETKPLRILGMVVPPDSSDPGLAGQQLVPMDYDHVTICKPLNITDQRYVQIRNFIATPIARPSGPPTVIAAGLDRNERRTGELPSYIDEKAAENLLAEMDHRGEMARITETGLERHAVLKLARRLKSSDLVRMELMTLIDLALRVIAKSEGSTNGDPLLGKVLNLLAETTKKGDFDTGAKIVDEALADLERQEKKWRDTFRRSREILLEAGIEQDVLRRDPVSAARRIEEISRE